MGREVTVTIQTSSAGVSVDLGDTRTVTLYRDGDPVPGGGGGVTDHGALTGLADDDHPQYALSDGTRGNFATAAQGAKADTATQPGDLGNSATRNVGTTPGTVAAGDDSRLSDARTPTSHAASHASGGGDPLSGLVSAQMPKWSQGSDISATTHNAVSADAGYMRPCSNAGGCAITFDSANIAAGDCGAYRADAGGGALSWAAGGTMTVVPLISGATSTQAAPAVLCWLCISSTLCYVWGQIE